MELGRIEVLLNKYFEAESTIKEEEELQEYFNSENVAPHLKEYIPLFRFSKTEKNIEYAQESKNYRKSWYNGFAIAASIAIIIGVVLFSNHNDEAELGTYEDPELALQKTKDVLNMVSFYMNQGQENLEYVSEFGEAANKLIKNP